MNNLVFICIFMTLFVSAQAETERDYVTITDVDYPVPNGWEIAELASGFAIGTAVELTVEIEDECLSNIATAVESAYWVGNVFLTQYQEDPQPQHVTVMVLFGLRGMSAAANVNCTNFTSDADAFLEELFGEAVEQAITPADEPEEPAPEKTELEKLLEVTELVTEVTALYTDAAMVFDKWFMANWFDFGYFAGSFILSAVNTAIKFPEYVDFFENIDLAEIPTDEIPDPAA